MVVPAAVRTANSVPPVDDEAPDMCHSSPANWFSSLNVNIFRNQADFVPPGIRCSHKLRAPPPPLEARAVNRRSRPSWNATDSYRSVFPGYAGQMHSNAYIQAA